MIRSLRSSPAEKKRSLGSLVCARHFKKKGSQWTFKEPSSLTPLMGIGLCSLRLAIFNNRGASQARFGLHKLNINSAQPVDT